jgi:proteasome lid subunit RPN8/RPN11
MIYASNYIISQLKDHAKECFPEECCGLFRCEKTDKGLEVTEIIKTKNVSKQKRIGAQIPRRIFKKFSTLASRLKNKGIYYGVYHSHPLTGSLVLSDQDVYSATIYKLFRKQIILGIKKSRAIHKTFWENKEDKTWVRNKIYIKHHA